MKKLILFVSFTIICISLSDLGAFPPTNGTPPTPAQLSAFMIQRFDSTGDQALNLEELTAAMTAFREHQRGGRGGGGGNQ